METKYTMSEPTTEEQSAFMNDFNELSKKHSLVISLVPSYEPVSIRGVDGSEKLVWTTVSKMLLKKSTPAEEVVAEKVEAGIPSTDPEVNPQA